MTTRPRSDKDQLGAVTVLQEDGERLVPEPLQRALQFVHGARPDEQEQYRAALDALRREPAQTVEMVLRVNRQVSRDAYPLRWSLRLILAELEDVSTLEFFVEDASREMPRLDYSQNDAGCEAPDEGELLLAVMSVEGIERLLTVDREAAVNALLGVVANQPHVAVRGVAVQALLTGAPDARQKIEEALPESQRTLLDLRRAELEDVTASRELSDIRARQPRRAGQAPILPEDSQAPRLESERS